jgi:hypothetical protein
MTYPYKQTQPPAQPAPSSAPYKQAQTSAPEPVPTTEPTAQQPVTSETKKWLVGALIAIIGIIILTVLVVSGEHKRTPPPTTPTPGALAVISDPSGELPAVA